MALALDGLLALLIVWLGWRAVTDADLLRAAIQFIALGLALALTWLRLKSPDLALAEAAVGSGLTGALLVTAVRRWESPAVPAPRRSAFAWASPRYLAAGAASLSLLGLLLVAAGSLPGRSPGLVAESAAALPASGVENPVTAVLLNYRAYDTLLEVAVLLAATVGVWSLRRSPPSPPQENPPFMLASLLGGVVPLLLLAGGYLLWIGAFAPGGAFQGGALLGGALVLLTLGGALRGLLFRPGLTRVALVIGLLVFLAVAAGMRGLTGGLLRYPETSAKSWILVIEAAGLLSIGATLGALFLGGRIEEQRGKDG